MSDGIGKKIGVGIVGASSTRGWAGVAHIPALMALNDFELRGISTTRIETARSLGDRLGLELAYDNHRDLVARPEIDLVVVCVKVPDHYEIVRAAIDAGKMIYCEWPLARSLGEAEELDRLAREKGLRTVVGLQGRMLPATVLLRDMIRQGAIGRPLSTSLRAHLDEDTWLGRFAPPYEFMANEANGATMLSIGVGHALEALSTALGDFRSLSAVIANRRGDGVRLRDMQKLPSDGPDEVSVIGVIEDGIVASLHYSAGLAAGRSIVWEIQGSEGSLTVEASTGGHLHFSDLTVTFRRGHEPARVLAIPSGETGNLGKGAAGVARLYRQLALDLAAGTTGVPDFGTAVTRHRTLDAIVASSRTGLSQPLQVEKPAFVAS